MSLLFLLPRFTLERQSDVRRKVAIGTTIGLTVGAVAGVLFAPKAGKETRNDLVQSVHELPDKARELTDRAHLIMALLPPSSKRVKQHTAKHVNEKIHKKTLDNIKTYQGKGETEINNRLRQLDQEWDTERVLEANASTIILVSTILGFKVSRLWFYMCGIVSFFLLQHALQGWCPPLPIIRGLGVRTTDEINEEEMALQTLIEK